MCQPFPAEKRIDQAGLGSREANSDIGEIELEKHFDLPCSTSTWKTIETKGRDIFVMNAAKIGRFHRDSVASSTIRETQKRKPMPRISMLRWKPSRID